MDARSVNLSVYYYKTTYMKLTILAFSLCLFTSNAFTQNQTSKKIPVIKVPDFAGAGVKSFYQSYADHLIKCIIAIREKNEVKAKALFKDPGEQLVAREKTLSKEVIKNAVEKEKYMQFAAEVYPYVKEVQQSEYYKKMYGR
jgi:hypothetical protein